MALITLNLTLVIQSYCAVISQSASNNNVNHNLMSTQLLLGTILIVARLGLLSSYCSYLSAFPQLRSLMPLRTELKYQLPVTLTESVPVSDAFEYGGTDAFDYGGTAIDEGFGTANDPTASADQIREKPGAWLPFIVMSSNDDEFPLELTVAGSTYVVWRNPLDRDNAENKGYSIMLDKCPHRFAPLSQGRVDTITGCIECPYHGWQFEATAGRCTSIPQLEASSRVNKPSARSLQVHITGDILWGLVPLPDGQASSYKELPETYFPQLKDPSRNFKLRDLPYSSDFLVENFMDPAHIPFAHHSLQAKRSDGGPIPMEILTDLRQNRTHCEVSFKDTIRNRTREGVLSFIAPCYYHFRTRSSASNDFKLMLLALVVPTTPGQCRILFSVNIPVSISRFIPKWFEHALSMRFLESDLWLHEAEIAARRSENAFYDSSSIEEQAQRPRGLAGLNYKLMTTSDTACVAWRRWWNAHMSQSPVFGASKNPALIPKPIQYNRYETHGKYCTHCKSFLQRGEQLKKYSPLVGLLFIAIGRSVFTKLMGVALYFALENISTRMIRAVNGPNRGEKVSAAQFGN